MFHPAAGLHQPRWRPLIEEDIKKLPALLEEARKSASSEAQGDDGNDEEHYEQLSLF
jgi:hypothetical protein